MNTLFDYDLEQRKSQMDKFCVFIFVETDNLHL